MSLLTEVTGIVISTNSTIKDTTNNIMNFKQQNDTAIGLVSSALEGSSNGFDKVAIGHLSHSSDTIEQALSYLQQASNALAQIELI
jgi:hypothetical protein